MIVGFMTDPRVEKLAKLCINYSVGVKPHERVFIEGSVKALPLLKELYRECLKNDAYPYILPNAEVMDIFYKHAQEHQLKYVSPFNKFVLENADVHISIFCETNPKYLSNVDTKKIAKYSAARKYLLDIFMKRALEKKLRWNGLPFPIDAGAQEASMSLEEYEDFVYNSCLINKKDPIAEWKKVDRDQRSMCDFLNKTKTIRIIGEDTDLSFNSDGRKWINCSGQENMPDGELFTGPHENSVNGTIRFTFPGIYYSREIEDINLTFRNGKVVKAKAAKGDELLQQLLKLEGANRIGEASIGMNYGIIKFTKNMLFDEKMGGTIHLALGASIPESGGVNKSPIHWDILKDMKKGSEIYADGKIFYKNGKFVL